MSEHLSRGPAIPAEAAAGRSSRPPISVDQEPDLWGGIAFFATSARAARALALGTRTRAFASVARWLGGEIISLEWDRGAENGQLQPIDLFPLPFGDGNFDSVILNEVLEWVYPWMVAGGSPRARQEYVLQECRRVLRPGGILLMLVDNRFSIANWGGKRHPTTGLRGFELLPRPLIHAFPQEVKQKAARYHSNSFSDWKRLLYRAGYTPERWQTLWPSVIDWNHAAALSTLPGQALSGPAGSRKERIADGLLRVARRLRIQHLASPNFLVVARKRGSRAGDPQPEMLLDQLIAAEGESGRGGVILSRFNNSRSFSFVAGGTFFKVPVTDHGVRNIQKEARALERVRAHPIQAHVPSPARLGTVCGVRYLAMPAIAADGGRKLEMQHLKEILTLLDHGSRPARLSETPFWQRCTDARLNSVLAGLGGRHSLDHVRGLADRQVSTGLVHGDLHLQNVLLGPDRFYIIDWNRCEEDAPRFLDFMEIATSYLMDRVPGMRLNVPGALELLITADPRTSMLQEIRPATDRLSITEMAICYAVNYANLQFRHRDPKEADRRIFEVLFSYCDRVLDREAARPHRRASVAGTTLPPAGTTG